MSGARKPGVMAEVMFRREAVPWALFGLTLGLVEGATAAVIVKHSFAGAASDWALNLAVAVVSGAPALSNVVSFLWSNVAHGRERIGLLVALQSAFAVFVGLVGLAPRAFGGLALTVVAVLLARTIWSGVITVRSSVWLANYPRHVLARVTGRILVLSSFSIAASSALSSYVLQTRVIDPRWLYGGAALIGLVGAWLYRGMRVRREYRLLAEERGVVGRSAAFSLVTLTAILRDDPQFRRYMFWMGLYGGGNLMLTSLLVVVLSDHLAIPGGTQILMLSVVPLVVLPLFVPWWARLFDRSHTVAYRARQGWALVFGAAVTCAGAMFGSQALLWIGAGLLGAAYAGASLGWNLGHNDFAAPGMAQHYMGVHVTLTGLRGLIAPPCGIAVYQLLEHWRPGTGRWTLLLPLIVTTAGVMGFNSMRRDLERRAVPAS